LALADHIDLPRARGGAVLGSLPGQRRHFHIAGIGVSPRPMDPGDPRIAQEMIKGRFLFVGRTVESIPGRIFHEAVADFAWREELNALGWLRHFVEGGKQFPLIVARSLILEWRRQPLRTLSTEARIGALIALAEAAEFLVGGSPSAFAAKLYETVERHAACLTHAAAASAAQRLDAAVALLYAATAFRMPAWACDLASARFTDAVDAVVLPDGGHVTRSPADMLALLKLLRPLQDAMRRAKSPVPHPMISAIDRMGQMLRMLSDEAGRLGHFQGAAGGSAVKQLLPDAEGGEALAFAPHAGFARLAQRDALLLADIGAPGACCSPLSLEFSDLGQPIVINCGAAPGLGRSWADALASPPAHSMLEVENFTGKAVHAVSSKLVTSSKGALLTAVDRMRLRHEKLAHHRSVFLSAAGDDLRGEDRVTGQPRKFSPHGLVLRFHIHHAVKAIRGSTGTTVSLLLPEGDIWTFRQHGGLLAIEDSVCSRGQSVVASLQIVVRAAHADGTLFKWSLRRSPKAQPVPYIKRKS
jgi:uncharacterized heparinase superfamily protein